MPPNQASTLRPTAAEPGPQRGRRRLIVALMAVSLVACVAAWTWSLLRAPDAPPPLPAARAEVIARRVGVVFADTSGVWRSLVRDTTGRQHGPAELVFFTREMPTPCAGAAYATGPFYCRDTRTAGFDMAYVDDLEARLRRDAELGTALVVARVAAAHVQGELGILDAASRFGRTAGPGERAALEASLSLQADCLTGVWAAAAAGGLGPVPAGFYGELIRISRNVTRDRARAGLAGPPEADIFFAAGSPAEHDAAFMGGYSGAAIDACPPPAR